MCNREQPLNKSLQQLLATNTTDKKKDEAEEDIAPGQRAPTKLRFEEIIARANVFFCETHSPPYHVEITLVRRLILKNQTLRRHLASTDRDDGLSDWKTPLFPKLERF